MRKLKIIFTALQEKPVKAQKRIVSRVKKDKTPEKVVKQVKYTVAFDSLTACDFKAFTDSSYISEERAIPEVLRLNATKEGSKTNIYTFDRGVTSTKTFSSFSEDKISFVGRLKIPRKYEVVASDQVSENDKDLGELTLISSQIVHLYDNGVKIDRKNIYRLIIAERKKKIDTTPPDNKGKFRKKDNIFYFFSNNLELNPKEIADIYKQRWDIEVFFRFIKQANLHQPVRSIFQKIRTMAALINPEEQGYSKNYW